MWHTQLAHYCGWLSSATMPCAVRYRVAAMVWFIQKLLLLVIFTLYITSDVINTWSIFDLHHSASTKATCYILL